MVSVVMRTMAFIAQEFLILFTRRTHERVQKVQSWRYSAAAEALSSGRLIRLNYQNPFAMKT